MINSGLSTALLALVGAIAALFFLLDAFWGAIQAGRALLAPFFLPHEETTLVKKYGAWALITGSTDGVGKAYAFELAKRGLNIVLVSRNAEKLAATAKQLENAHNVKTKIIVADFAKGIEAIEAVKGNLGELPIGILVNNVGKQYEYPMYLEEVPEQELWDIIAINVGAVTLMTRALIEGMSRRGRGAVVNVSSGSELQPLPLMTVYAATKAYIKSFSAALRYEYARSGITVQHLSPMFINTKMNQFSSRLQKTSMFVPDAASYAKFAVSTLGKMDNSTGYWAHGIQAFFTKIAPEWIRMHIGGHLNTMFREDYFAAVRKN